MPTDATSGNNAFLYEGDSAVPWHKDKKEICNNDSRAPKVDRIRVFFSTKIEFTNRNFNLIFLIQFFFLTLQQNTAAMDNLGDIIYLLVLVVFALTGMIGKKSKAKNKPSQSPTSPAPDTPNPWEELERQLLPRMEQPPKPQPAVRPERPLQQKMFEAKSYSSETLPHASLHEKPLEQTISYDTVDDVSQLRVKKQLKESVTRSRSALRTSENNLATETLPASVNIALDSVDEARQAFIYAEIFNRKYT